MRACTKQWNKYIIGAILILQFMSYGRSQYPNRETSFAYLNLRSSFTPQDGVRFCVNFEEVNKMVLPETPEKAEPLHLEWWAHKFGERNVCMSSEHVNYAPDAVVPIAYRTIEEESSCEGADDLLSFLSMKIRKQNITHAFWLLNRGAKNAYNTHDYLYNNFENQSVRAYGPKFSFYTYNDTFFNDILPYVYGPGYLNKNSNDSSLVNPTAEFRFYARTYENFFNFGVLLVIVLPTISVLLGSALTAYDTCAERNLRESNSTCDAAESLHINERVQAAESGCSIERSNVDACPIIKFEDAKTVTTLHTSSSSSFDAPKEIRALAGTNVSNEKKQTKKQQQKRLEKEKTVTAQPLISLPLWAQSSTVGLYLVLSVTNLLVLYFFRNYFVQILDVYIYILGVLCVYKCLYSILQIIFSPNRARGKQDFDVDLFKIGELCCGNYYLSKREMNYKLTDANSLEAAVGSGNTSDNAGNEESKGSNSKKKLSLVERILRSNAFTSPVRLLSLLTFCASFTFCTVWLCLWWHNNPYATIMLNFINICVCAMVIRFVTIFRSLKLLTLLLVAFFFYDVFMVFGTKLLTQDGCSVMEQAVTGANCTNTLDNGNLSFVNVTLDNPVSPIDKIHSSRISLVFYAPTISIDPCYDFEADSLYNFMLIGLGDVILPGFLMTYCFYIDVAKRHRFYSMGIIVSIGYVIGVFLTLVVLVLMKMAQPALIYIVPFTLIPIILWSWCCGILREVWLGGDLICSSRPQPKSTSTKEVLQEASS